MKRFFIEVLHEESMIEDSLLDLTGGITGSGCEAAQLCNVNCPKLVCGENCPSNTCPTHSTCTGKSLQG